MKTISYLPLILLCTMVACHPKAELKKNFANPPLAFRMNQNIHHIPADTLAQDSLISHFLLNGYGGFAANVDFHNYLTDNGMRSFRRFCDQARDTGMSLWLYDEQGYPSGNAGDRVIATNPEWESMGLYARDTLCGPGKMSFDLPPGEPVQLTAFPVHQSVTDWETRINLNSCHRDGALHWQVPAGSWRVLAVTRYRLYEQFQASHKDESKIGANYPSLMLPEVTNRFIELTHEAYRNYFGYDLGKWFLSTFTDEPSLMAVPFGLFPWSVIPWTSLLSDEMERLYGYRPEDKPEKIFLIEGPDGQKARYQYYQTMADLIADNYFVPVRRWCNEHGILSGGHLLLEETLMAHVPLYGDAFRCLREMDAPGIDVLSCFPALTPVHSPKLASSAAELSGATRVMCEPCPVADRIALDGKETPASHVRGFLNIQLLGGVTDFNNYLQLSNSDQVEKIGFNTWVARIALLLRGGYTKADIAVVYPIETMWTHWIPRPVSVAGWDSVSGGHPDAIRVEQTFRNISRFLYNNRWEYRYIDSKAIRESSCSKGTMIHGNLTWKVIILPDVTTLPLDAWKKLDAFVSEGGHLIALGGSPVNSGTDFPDEQVSQIRKRIFSGKHTSIRLESWTPAVMNHYLENNLERDFTIENDDLPLRYAHRCIDGKDCYFIINDSEREIHTRLRFAKNRGMEEWDPATGTTRPVKRYVDLHLMPFHGKVYR